MTENQFKEIVDLYSSPVVNVINRMIHNTETAYDLAQDVFIKIWNYRSRVDMSRPLFTFIYRIAINICIDFLRKQSPEYLDNDVLDIMAADEHQSDEEIYNLILFCAADLKPKQKAIFILRDIEGFTFTEIADTLNMSINNIQSNLHLARKKIRNLLETKYQLTLETIYEM